MSYSNAELLALKEKLPSLSSTDQAAVEAVLTDELWRARRRAKQTPPEGLWPVWAITSGRGFGKTETGAQWVRQEVLEGRARHIALVERTPSHAREIMVRRIMEVHSAGCRPRYEPTRRRLVWPNGAIAHVYTAAEPDDLRGPEHDLAWGEEVAAWKYAKDALSNLQLGLRVGDHPRLLVTTTPKPLRWLADFLKRPDVVHVTGSTYENRDNLPDLFLNEILGTFEGTHLGQQEIHGELLGEMPGALFTRSLLDQTRVADAGELDQVAVGVDPATTNRDDSDETGIVICGARRLGDDLHGFVLADRSGRFSPEQWGRQCVLAANQYSAPIVAESNQGGDMVRACIRAVRPRDGDGADGRHVRVLLRHASQGKAVRAEPVVLKFEQARCHLVGTFTELEDQLCTWEPLGKEASPDRMDAMVYALRELIVEHGIGWTDLYGEDSHA